VDHLLADDPAKECDVGGEHRDAEGNAGSDPHRVPLVDLAERVLEVEQLGNQNVDRDQQQDDGDRRLDEPLRVGEEAGLSLRDPLMRGLFLLLSAWRALLPHAPDVRKVDYSVATRSRRCSALLTTWATGSM
jgi:hypothetical protein